MFDFHTLIALNVFGAVGFIVGYWIGHRTWVGVKSDLGDVKQDLANIKGVLTPTPIVQAQPVAVVADGKTNPRSK